MKKTKETNASIFELNGIPQLSKALPLALQHVVAMIVGCVTPAIIVAGVAELEGTNRVMLIQSALVVSALSTFLQLFPIGSKKGFRLGAGLPVIMGTSFCICGKRSSLFLGIIHYIRYHRLHIHNNIYAPAIFEPICKARIIVC